MGMSWMGASFKTRDELEEFVNLTLETEEWLDDVWDEMLWEDDYYEPTAAEAGSPGDSDEPLCGRAIDITGFALFERLIPASGSLPLALSGGAEITGDVLGLGGWRLLEPDQVASIARDLEEMDPQVLVDRADPKELARLGLPPHGGRWTRRRVVEIFNEEWFTFVDFYRVAAEHRAHVAHLLA